MIETVSLDYLVPSWWEIKVTVAASLFVILAYWYFTHRACGDGNSDRSLIDNTSGFVDAVVVKEKTSQLKGVFQTNSAYIIKVELLAAKNLIGANLNGTSDPYVIINCGTEKRFSSMVPGSRNPMWGEEFNFAVDELPVQDVRNSPYDVTWQDALESTTHVLG